MPIPCRLLLDPPQSGAQNMAADEALLSSAANGGLATLRIYTWSEPTLSLGYFQSIADRTCHPASSDCAVVRRRSGGGAILHDRELTYSLTLPPGSEFRNPLDVYHQVHHAIVGLLAFPAIRAGLKVRQSAGITRSPTAEPFLCFQRRSPGDVVLAKSASESDVKVAGSAQRKHRGAVLQHGSLLLETSPQAPELAGLAELCGWRPTIGGVTQDFVAQLEEQGGFSFRPGAWTDQEQAETARFMANRFTLDQWNRSR